MRGVKRQPSPLGRCIASAAIILSVCSVFAAGPYDSATVTRVANKVTVGEIKEGKASARRAAAVSDVVKANNFVLTASESRTELEFKDKSLARVGQNSVFTFEAKSRTLSLQKGDMLLYVPPGPGGTIKTPAFTAAITGGLAKSSVDLVAVLRGKAVGTIGDQTYTLTPGWALKVVNGKALPFQFPPYEGPAGKLYAMGPLPEDPGIQIAEDGTLLYIPNSGDQNAQDSGQVNPNVRRNSNPPTTVFVPPPTPLPTPAPTPRPHPSPTQSPGAGANRLRH